MTDPKSLHIGIQRATLTTQVVDRLKQRILDGELVSGDRLWAADLAEEFGTSIVPVKEALLILQAENFLTNVPRRGSIVRQFTPIEMEDLYDLRELIEIEAIKRAKAAGAIDGDLIAELTNCNEKIGALREDGGFSDQATAFELDRHFHDILVGAADHSALGAWYTRLNQHVQIIRYASWNIGPRGDKTYEEHARIIDALRDQDLRTTKSAISAHLNSIRCDFRTTMDRGSDEESDLVGGAKTHHGRRRLKRATS